MKGSDTNPGAFGIRSTYHVADVEVVLIACIEA